MFPFLFVIYKKIKETEMFRSYKEFINESEKIKVEKELREFTLTHLHDAIFQLRGKDFSKEFSVFPYKDETREKLKNTFNRLVDAISQESVERLYDTVLSAEKIDYKYGNVFSSKFSLISIPEIDVHLTDEQKNTLKTSEREFLLNDYSGLQKSTRDDIVEELIHRAQILCCVIDALFYYIRKIDKKNFYNGLSVDEIVDEYEKSIKKSSKEQSFSYDGPSSVPTIMTPLQPDSKKVYWLCEKDLKKFIIFGTINIQDLHSEENIGGTTGLKLSVSLPDDKIADKDFNYFNLEELSERVKIFYKKFLKK